MITDTERLDYLERRANQLLCDVIGFRSSLMPDSIAVLDVWTSPECETEALGVGPTLRDAIDAAMAEESGATA